MEIQKLTGRLGALVEDIDLETIDDSAFGALHDALMAHQVIFIRDQRLSDDGHRRLAGLFGTPTVYPVSKHFGGTEYLHVIEAPRRAHPTPTAGTWTSHGSATPPRWPF